MLLYSISPSKRCLLPHPLSFFTSSWLWLSSHTCARNASCYYCFCCCLLEKVKYDKKNWFLLCAYKQSTVRPHRRRRRELEGKLFTLYYWAIIIISLLQAVMSTLGNGDWFHTGKEGQDGKICRKKANKTHSTTAHIYLYIEMYLVAHMFLQPAN